jgi:transposase-like protein
MARKRRFTKEYKAEAVRLAREVAKVGKSVGVIAKELDLTETSLRAWIKQADVDEGRAALAAAGITCSMSRKGNCYDNAVAESFFATLKTKLVHATDWTTRAEARSAIFEHLEVFYNQRRPYSSIGYVSPEEFELSTKKRRWLRKETVHWAGEDHDAVLTVAMCVFPSQNQTTLADAHECGSRGGGMRPLVA